MNAPIVQERKFTLRTKIGWAVLLLMAVYPVWGSRGYLTLDPEELSFAEQTAVYLAHHTMLMVHIVASMLAIVIGPFQFLPRIRKGRLLKIHRWLGRVYLLSVLAGGIGGLYMAQFAYGGLIARVGFATLAIFWLYSGYRAYRQIRTRDIEGHRQWMIRNYALTLAGTLLRVWVPVLVGVVGVEFTVAYIIIAWLCWVPNLLVAEWIIRRRSQRVALPGTTISVQETA
jgi:uncharacterized membrane protein